MTDYRRFYCTIRVDATFNAGNLPKQNIQELNESIETVLEEWATKMMDRGLKTDVGWNWSEHVNV